MRVLVQRSLASSVEVYGKKNASIDKGLVLFVSFTNGDNEEKVLKMINKILKLRIFPDDNNVMNNPLPLNASILSISQFTLYANTQKGNRPSYSEVLNGEQAKKLYDFFNRELSKFVRVETGIFGENMQINIINDGPVTILLEI